MDAKFGGERRKIYNAETSNGVGKKKGLEWDLNDWKWDGHQFVATPLNASPTDCGNKQIVAVPALNCSSSCSEEAVVGIMQKSRGELEKRRKVAVEDNGLCGEDGSLSLKLGGHNYPVVAEGELGNNGKSSKLLAGSSSRAVCQVEGCGDDLRSAKDYHRRHKVCETHAKASWAMVGSVRQRFCQQCSRFHLLEEFDEGKRSCRRQLAGHNRRRRKTHPDTSISGNTLIDDNAGSYLLINLLKILTNLHSDKSDKSNDQDLVSHLLENIASLACSPDSRNLSGTLQTAQGLYATGTSAGEPYEAANALLSNGVATKESSRNPLCSSSKATCNKDIMNIPLRSVNHSPPVPVATLEMPSIQNVIEAPRSETVQAVPSQCSPTLKPARDVLLAQRGASCSLQHMLPAESAKAMFRANNFDLNCTYNETQDCGGGCEQPFSSNRGSASNNLPTWMLKGSLQSSPPQTKSRTDRIIFKLFGKDPNDFPHVLRAQILDWLSHSPTDMESYIRPGCVILTIYLCLDDSIWEELNRNLCSSLMRLLCISGDNFWRTGWVNARLQNHMAFAYKGNIVLDITPLLLENPDNCQIVSVTPVAAAISARVSFTVQGFNLAGVTARLLCAFDGKYLVTETTHPLVECTDPSRECEGYQYLSFSCSLPDASGRGVIEVEDHCLSSGFFPFVVAEEEVCCEIRMLENSINMAPCDDILQEKLDVTSARNQAINFLNEMGWLLRRSQLKVKHKQVNSPPVLFSLKRFRWLMTFSMDREWCAVVKKLLDILFQEVVDLGGSTPSELALSENLLHVAVKKNHKLMVKFLVTYKPDTASGETTRDGILFRPDMLGLSDMTPLHIAASIGGAEGVLDALINDPGQYGIEAWKSARDSTGFTPEDYARYRGHQSYILLVQKKINNTKEMGHVVLDIPGGLSAPEVLRQSEGHNSSKLTGFNIEKSRLTPTHQQSCKLCDQQLAFRSSVSRSLLYRPLMLSMVGIAAVCVCVGLLFKGPPEVIFVHAPFRWESLSYGTM